MTRAVLKGKAVLKAIAAFGVSKDIWTLDLGPRHYWQRAHTGASA